MLWMHTMNQQSDVREHRCSSTPVRRKANVQTRVCIIQGASAIYMSNTNQHSPEIVETSVIRARKWNPVEEAHAQMNKAKG